MTVFRNRFIVMIRILWAVIEFRMVTYCTEHHVNLTNHGRHSKQYLNEISTHIIWLKQYLNTSLVFNESKQYPRASSVDLKESKQYLTKRSVELNASEQYLKTGFVDLNVSKQYLSTRSVDLNEPEQSPRIDSVDLNASKQYLKTGFVDLNVSKQYLSTSSVDLNAPEQSPRIDSVDLNASKQYLKTGSVDLNVSKQHLRTSSVDLNVSKQYLGTGSVDLNVSKSYLSTCWMYSNVSFGLPYRELFVTKTDYALILKILKVLSWASVTIIYGHQDERNLQNLLHILEDMSQKFKMKIYDVMNMKQDQIKSVLRKINSENMDGNILILNNETRHFLYLVNTFDDESNRTTNFQTDSKWILLTHLNKAKLDIEFKLKHVIIVNYHAEFLRAFSVQDKRNLEIIHCLYHKVTCSLDDLYPNLKYKLNGRHLLIGTIFKEHNIIIKGVDENNKTIVGGLLGELTKILAQKLNFTYTIIESPENRHGTVINNTWTGLVGQLYYQNVDIVIADLTVTSDRMEVIDFIQPEFFYQNLGVIYRKNIADVSNLAKVFRPLSLNVYLCLFGSILGVGILLYSIDMDFDRYSSFDSEGKRNLSKFLKLLASLSGFISLRGNGLFTKKDSAQILIVYFWFFSMVLAATYVGNLTAKLTEKLETPPFNSMEELVELDDWKWGINGEGLLEDILKSSKNGVLKKLWEGIVKFNRSDPKITVFDPEFHLEKVLNSSEKYALIVFDPKLYMFNSVHCDIAIVDSVISSLGLALAVSKNSYLKEDLEKLMWDLSNNGFLQLLQDNWHKDKRPNSCKVSVTKRPMRVNDMLGLIPIMACGLTLAFLVLFFEIFLKKKKR